MKKFLIIPLLFLACKKKEVTPAPEPAKFPTSFNYRVSGLSVIDTAELSLNGKKLDPQYGRAVKFNAGDTLSFYYAGNFRSLQNFDFAYWDAGNKIPAETIKYFKGFKRTWISEVKYINSSPGTPEGEGGKSGKDSVIVYGWRWVIKEKIIL